MTRTLRASLLAGCCWAAFASTCFAQPALEREDVEAWLDGFLPYALQHGDIAGAVVIVVKDGRPLLEKGYGYADVARKTPVDAQGTLFRPGSVSKLFTWTAVMQLVEQGKLDLDTDVNTYLDFKIPARAGAPVTLRNALTHTGGFEETLKGAYSLKPEEIAPLGPYVKAWIPERVYAPGTTPAYSNYATALAGYIVQRVSGEPYDEYMEHHILGPLGMTHTTSRQPLPEQFKSQMARGYLVGSGPAQPFEIYGPGPAGSFSAAGADMARFMIAHLQRGAYGDAHILKPETATMMHETPLTLLPLVNRMLLGFFETNRNGHRVIAHAGDTQFFHSVMHLFIDDGVGIYISLNSLGKDGASAPIRTAFFEQFADRYLPGRTDDGRVDAKTAAQHARMMVGQYSNSRGSRSNFLSILSLLGQVKVTVDANGLLSVAEFQGINGVPKKWREIAPFVWRDMDGEERLAAKVVDGRVTMFSTDDISPFIVFMPTPWQSSATLWVPLLIASLVALGLTVMLWPIAALVRRRYHMPLALVGRELRAHRLIRLLSFAALAVFLAWPVTILSMSSGNISMTSASDGWIGTLHFLGLIVFVGGVLIAVWNGWLLFRSGRTVWSKIWSAVLVVAFCTLLWIAVTFHLISFSANY